MNKIDQQDLQFFAFKCDALIASKLIISDKKITDILKCIASSRSFCKFIEHCIKDFNYFNELKIAEKPHPEKAGNILVLPKGENLVAFVFCLLCEFDNKERDLTEFLQDYYGLDELFNDGFANFCNEVIKPFKETVITLCSDLQSYDEQDEFVEYITQNDEKQECECAEDDSDVIIPQSIISKIVVLCDELVRNISRESLLNLEQRNEYTIVVKGFLESVNSKNTKFIKALFLALKHLCSGYKFLNMKVIGIEKIIKDII